MSPREFKFPFPIPGEAFFPEMSGRGSLMGSLFLGDRLPGSPGIKLGSHNQMGGGPAYPCRSTRATGKGISFPAGLSACTLREAATRFGQKKFACPHSKARAGHLWRISCMRMK
jgi:hypothetical protein